MKKEYYSTHRYLIDQFGDLPEVYISHLLSKQHEVRKIQDKYCYIHSVTNGKKVFNPIQHKKLETAIRNNLKFFPIEYVPELADSDIKSKMDQEAITQKNMLKRCSYNFVVYNRIPQIGYFLNYCYSRSYDHYIKFVKFLIEQNKDLLKKEDPKKAVLVFTYSKIKNFLILAFWDFLFTHLKSIREIRNSQRSYYA